MSSSDYIGRVGGLAAALGIGAAVLMSPGVAWAGPDSSSPSGSSAGASTDTSSDTSTSGSSRTARSSARSAASAAAGSGTRVRPGRTDSALPDVSDVAAQTDVSDVVDAVAEQVSAPRANRSKNSDAPSAAAATPATAAPVSTPAPAAAVTSVLPSVTAPAAQSLTVAPAAAVPAQSLQDAVAKVSSLLQVKPIAPKPHVGTILASVADRLSTALNGTLAKIIDSLANGSPFGPKIEGPLNWLLLAVTRKQLLPAATANVVSENTATPALVLNGYDVVPTSKLIAVSFYGPYTTWPGYSGLQGTQEFDLVDPDTGDTVGSFTAHVRQDNYTSSQVLQVTEVRSGTVGTAPGQTPPVGSIISITGQGKKVSTVYSDMPTANGPVNGYTRYTPLGTRNLRTAYHATTLLTDYASVNKPLDMLNGFFIAPEVPSSENFTTIAGMPPTFTAVQGTQLYGVFDGDGNQVGYFDGLVTTTSDFFGLDTKLIVVMDTGDQTNVGLGAGQVPPAGTVYNVLYFTDTRYVLYQSSPTPDGQYVSTKLVLPRRNIPLTLGNMDASYPPPLGNFQLPGGASFAPTAAGPMVGGNGLPPREMEAQGSEKYDVLDANGNKVGSFDSYLTRQWDWGGIWQDEILVIDVTQGTGGVNGVPPVGTVYTTRMVGSTGFGELYVSTPTAGGGAVSKHYYVTPFGYLPWFTPKDSAYNVDDVQFINPFVP